jgi:hypothetical protein
MKKYILGLAAIVCALAFSAFTKPFDVNTFKLLTEPTVSNIVNDDAQWSTAGINYGNCLTATPVDIACKIVVATTQSSYFHTSGSDIVLNTLAYADAQNPKQDYLQIAETTGKDLGGGVFDRIISSIQPRHYNTTTSSYENASLGADLSFTNAKD